MINKLDFYEFIFDLRGNRYEHPDYWGVQRQLIQLNYLYNKCWNEKGFIPISIPKLFEFARIVEESDATDELEFSEIWQDYFAYPKYPIGIDEDVNIRDILPEIIDRLDNLDDLRKDLKILD